MDLMRQHDGAAGTEHDRQLDTAWRTHAAVAMRFATAMVGPADAHDVKALR